MSFILVIEIYYYICIYKKLKELFIKSGLTKAEFSRKCGIKKQNLNPYLTDLYEMKLSTFEKIKKKYYERS
jgi:transcriptional regulator with XRE-family HTH domain